MLTIIPTTPNSPVKLIVDSMVHTMPLQAISSDGALKPCRELSVKRRKTHYSCRCWLRHAAPVSPFDLQQGWNSKANTDLADLYLPTDTCSTEVHTYVIVMAGAVEMLVDNQLFNQEGLFLLCIGFIDGLLPQVYWELADVGGVTEQRDNISDLQKNRRHRSSGRRQGCFWMSHPSSKQWAAVTTQQGEMREPPQRKP